MKKVDKAKTEWKLNSEDYTRKYRPKKMSDMVGQAMLKYTIRGWTKKRQVPGTILIQGMLGSGKTTAARIIAAVLNCADLQDNGEPCGECPSCKALLTQTSVAHPDYIEINCADNTGVDHMRTLKERASYKPRNNCLVIVLDEVHKLSPASQNLILKSTEEPHAHVRYILLTTEPQSILDTLRSRCAELTVDGVSVSENVKLMQSVCTQENVKLDDAVLEMICHKSDNIPRKCLVNLQKVAGMLETKALAIKDIKLDDVEAKLSKVLGTPNYVSVQQYLAGMYSGKISSALLALAEVASKPMFLKGCIETHGNVITLLSLKDPESVIKEKWVLGTTKKLVSTSGLDKSPDTLRALSGLMVDIVDAYTKMGAYQLGDSNGLLVSIPAKWCVKFKEARG